VSLQNLLAFVSILKNSVHNLCPIVWCVFSHRVDFFFSICEFGPVLMSFLIFILLTDFITCLPFKNFKSINVITLSLHCYLKKQKIKQNSYTLALLHALYSALNIIENSKF